MCLDKLHEAWSATKEETDDQYAYFMPAWLLSGKAFNYEFEIRVYHPVKNGEI